MKSRVFQAAIEIAMHAVMPQGMSVDTLRDKLTAGTRKPAASPDGYGPREWARDFLDCLPDDPELQRLLMLHYLPAYVCRCNAIHFEAGRCDDCGTWRESYRMSGAEAGRCGGSVRHFWGRVQERRLFAQGLRLAEGR